MAGDQASPPSGAPKSRSDPTTTNLNHLWPQIEDIFHRALDLPEGDRASRVAEWCGTNTQLLSSVMQLLAADSSVEQLIAAPPESFADDFLLRTDGATPDFDLELESCDPWIGRTLGAFRLEALLGRGGMGVVYRAERISGGFSQTVAVKLLGQHLHSSPAVAMFLEERQALARLEHPNIARLLDGGVTDEGFPYVVMEYIEGQSLDQACDDPSTTGDQILRWFLQLCDAVAYVHRNLILHRDLKPGNVMVSNEGAVKLLDFGALKHIAPDSDAASALTQAGLRPVSVRYSSPEHIQGKSVTTASDVYSLGMILYRLVAGQLPSGKGEASIGIYLDRLQDRALKPPSRVASENTEPTFVRRFPSEVANDLDAIVARAIRFEADARYPTVHALAEEIWSILLHRPVKARQGGFSYRAIKFYHRHRWPILIAAAAITVTTVGVIAMQWQTHQARLQERRADRGVEEERKLLHLLLSDYFDQLKRIPGSVEAQRKAVTLAVAYLDNLNHIALSPELELDTIRGYTRMGNLQGDPYEQNLGEVSNAIRTLSKAIDLAQKRASQNPRDLEAIRLLATAKQALGSTYQGTGDVIHGEQMLLSATNTISGPANDTHADAKLLLLASSIADSLGDLYNPFHGAASSDVSRSMHYYLEANRYDNLCIARSPENDHCASGLLLGEYKIGTLVEDDDPELAGRHYRQGLDAVLKFSPELMKVANSRRLKSYLMARLALTRIKTGHQLEGDALFAQAHELFLTAIAKDEKDNRARFDLVAHDTDLIPEYDRLNREHEAEKVANEALDQLGILVGRSPNNTYWRTIQAQNMLESARVELKLGKREQSGKLRQSGTDIAVNLAQSKDASPQVLDLASEALLESSSPSKHSATDTQLALAFAQRAAKSFENPAVEQLLDLAKAQAAAGQHQNAIKTAQDALTKLNGPVKSTFIEDRVTQARSLISREQTNLRNAGIPKAAMQ